MCDPACSLRDFVLVYSPHALVCHFAGAISFPPIVFFAIEKSFQES